MATHWNGKRLEYEQSLKGMGFLEAEVARLKQETKAKDTLILNLKKSQKSNEFDLLRNKVQRLQVLAEEKDLKIENLEIKMKKVQAQFEVMSKQKTGSMGMSLDTVSTVLLNKVDASGVPVKKPNENATGVAPGLEVGFFSVVERLSIRYHVVAILVNNPSAYIVHKKLMTEYLVFVSAYHHIFHMRFARSSASSHPSARRKRQDVPVPAGHWGASGYHQAPNPCR